MTVKDGDYDIESVVGSSEDLSWCGQVKIVPVALLVDSTTRLIERRNQRVCTQERYSTKQKGRHK